MSGDRNEENREEKQQQMEKEDRQNDQIREMGKWKAMIPLRHRVRPPNTSMSSRSLRWSRMTETLKDF